MRKAKKSFCTFLWNRIPIPMSNRALQKAIPVLKATGVVIVPVSDLVK
ncbi:MAG: hypothetical protein WCH07_00405 [Deltaproteobacteria bacterium]